MIKYKRWLEIMVYPVLIQEAPVNKARQVISEGWYLFGKISLFIRENI